VVEREVAWGGLRHASVAAVSLLKLVCIQLSLLRKLSFPSSPRPGSGTPAFPYGLAFLHAAHSPSIARPRTFLDRMLQIFNRFDLVLFLLRNAIARKSR